MMRLLLIPRANAAYGQDFLAPAIAGICGLTVLVAQGERYSIAPKDVRLVISVNLDEKSDAGFVSTLAANVSLIAMFTVDIASFLQNNKRIYHLV